MVKERINLTNVDILINGVRVGGAEELSVSASFANEFAHEGGGAEPVEIVDGKREYSGSLSRAFIDTELVKSLAEYGQATPYFNLQGITKNKTPARKIKVENAKLDGFDINSLSIDGYAKNALPFKCLAVKPY